MSQPEEHVTAEKKAAARPRRRRSTFSEQFARIAEKHSIKNNVMRLDNDERVIIIDRKRSASTNNQQRSAVKPLTNLFDTDDKTIAVIFDERVTAQAIFHCGIVDGKWQ